jgi:hypothetical protein
LVSGRITFQASDAPLPDVTVQLRGPQPSTSQTDLSGLYELPGVGAGSWQIEPSKVGNGRGAITAIDATFTLQAVVGLRTLSAEQRLASDTNGSGTITAIDAVFILQYAVGLIGQVPIGRSCGSDWAFMPVGTGAANQSVTLPVMVPGSCELGRINLESPTAETPNQNFRAVLLGDVNASWQPAGGSGAAMDRGSDGVQLGAARRRGHRIYVPIRVERNGGIVALDAELEYDATRLRLLGVRRSSSLQGAMLMSNSRHPGRVSISLASPEPQAGRVIAMLRFEETAPDVGDGAIRVLSAEIQ